MLGGWGERGKILEIPVMGIPIPGKGGQLTVEGWRSEWMKTPPSRRKGGGASLQREPEYEENRPPLSNPCPGEV